MGKQLDSRVAEYAILDRMVPEFDVKIIITPEEIGEPVIKYQHVITIFYIMRDINGVDLETKHKTHYTEFTDIRDTTSQRAAKIASNMYEWVRQDKIDLVDYDIGPEI